jgi:uncharacterized membrane protein (UPF0127 family)
MLNYQKIALACAFVACCFGVFKALDATTPPRTPAPSAIRTPTPSAVRGQQLPLSAKFIARGETIFLEVARTQNEQAMGLMYRTSLAKDRGMSFPFSPPQPAQFWMKNTLIPLDMIFLYRGKIVAIRANVPPCRQDPCPAYGPSSDVLVDNVIELAAGRARELNIAEGGTIVVLPATIPSVRP